ncbi:Protein CBG04689 [Caenorhabditis briggsae]|uniref:Protein CBG04689 n=1 Tax=Caenorhabditis briggsae TaxID=6238 RepID=A8WY87_CAEBR|nr:Protein CBG04689 [Caenorhabditis briggsae]CAP25345.2 Protein CBG04689 [Caenorhabditis briggsae]
MNLPILIFISILVTCSAINPKKLPECNDEELSKMERCIPRTDYLQMVMRYYEDENQPVENYKDAALYCTNILDCLAPLNCREAEPMKLEFETVRENLEYKMLELKPCLARFFTRTYLIQHSRNSSCLKDYSFLDKDLTIKSDEYIEGEACFLNTIKSLCGTDAMEYYTKNYQKFVTTISTEPEDAKCSHPHFQLNSLQCRGLELEIILRIDSLKERKYKGSYAEFTEINQMCEDAQHCLSVNECQKFDTFKTTLEKSCELLDYLGDQFHCLTGFFKEAYSSNGSTCFQKCDFLEKDLSKKREAFEKGKSCFTDYVKDHCNQTSIDFFSKNYQEFVNDISIKPNDTDGQSPHKVLNTFRCDALGKQIQNEILELHAMKLESNDTRVPKMNKMCKDMQYCVDDSCFVKEHTKHTVEHTCNLLEMVHKRSFAACASKLMKDKPDFLDYECLDGLDLYDQ